MDNILPRSRRIGLWGAAIAVLAAVFALYLEPEFAVALANRIWACF